MLSLHIAEQARKQGSQDSTLVLFTGGGTGGHVYPGLAVLDRVRERGARVAWIGGTSGMERALVERWSALPSALQREPDADGAAAVPFYGIPTGKLRRYLSLRNVGDVFRVIAGIIRSVGIVGRLRPAVLFSKGGFVSVPPVIAAWMLRVPVVSHESDCDPGLATRINARFSSRILVPYASTVATFPARLRPRVSVTGNPLRPEITRGSRSAGLAVAGFDGSDARPIVLVLGGSQGARQLNELVEAIGPQVESDWRIIHQTGANPGARANGPAYYSSAFFGDELPDLLAAADVLVCRAGASTLWEAAALAKPMLLVPLATGSRGDQVRNAALFERAGGAKCFVDPAALADDVRGALDELARSPAARAQMGRLAREAIRLDATDVIAGHVERYVHESAGRQATPREGKP